MNVYISGPITGLDKARQRYNFDSAQAEWEEKGYMVINPFPIAKESYEEGLRSCIRLLCECDTIYMLNGWAHSLGAKLEHKIAHAIGMNILYEDEHDEPI